jgi:hypothetical protein
MANFPGVGLVISGAFKLRNLILVQVVALSFTVHPRQLSLEVLHSLFKEVCQRVILYDIESWDNCEM